MRSAEHEQARRGDDSCEYPLRRAAWRAICDASRKEFNAIYERLGIQLEERCVSKACLAAASEHLICSPQRGVDVQRPPARSVCLRMQHCLTMRAP